MTEILKGNNVAAQINQDTKDKTERLKAKGVIPKLAIVRVGEKPDDKAYERRALSIAGALGIHTAQHVLPENVSQKELSEVIRGINLDKRVHGALILRPLPDSIDEELIRNTLVPEKDIDGITDLSLAGVFTSGRLGYPPCTAEACIRILDFYKVDIKGKRAVVMGRSQVVGKPVAMMLLDRNATVTICHTKTEELAEETKRADILIVATGHPNTVGEGLLFDHQVIVDVGINMVDGEMTGDVDFTAAEGKVKAITPVPGGVGGVTTSVLMNHVVCAAMEQTKDR